MQLKTTVFYPKTLLSLLLGNVDDDDDDDDDDDEHSNNELGWAKTNKRQKAFVSVCFNYVT